MKCKINVKDLKTALVLHKKIIGTKTNVFILAGIKLKTGDNSVEIFSTNLEWSLKTKLESEVATAGEVLLPFTVLNNTVNVCDDEFIEIELKEDNRCKVDKMLINVMDLKEFPLFPEPENEKTLEDLNFKDFVGSVSKIIKTVSVDENRVILTGMCFDTKNNAIVGTNSYILGVSKFNFNNDIGRFILPGKCFPILKDILKIDKTPEFKLSVMENQTEFTIGKHIFVIRNLTGKYPEYMQLIPSDFSYVYNVNCHELIKKLDKSIKLGKEGKWDSTVPVEFKFSKNQLHITRTMKEIGTYEDELQIEVKKQEVICEYEVKHEDKTFGPFKTLNDARGYVIENYHNPDTCNIVEKPIEDLLIAFNPYFLKVVLENFETVDLHLKDPLRPMVVKNNGDLQYLIMPIRVS